MKPRRPTSPRPLFLLIPGLIAIAFLVIPLVGLLAEAPWGSFGSILTSPVALEALRISLVTSIAATGVAIVIGTPLAWLLARELLPGTKVLRAMVIVPLLLPRWSPALSC